MGSERRRLSLLLLAVALVVLGCWGLSPPPRGAGRRLSCAEAQIVDGVLACEGELRRRCTARTRGAPTVEVSGGDRLDTRTCARSRMDPEDLEGLGQPVDLNTASVEELASLPGIGPALGAAIVAGRPYAAFEEITRVRGIGPARSAALRGRGRVEPGLRAP